jgi:hypothetical protein
MRTSTPSAIRRSWRPESFEFSARHPPFGDQSYEAASSPPYSAFDCCTCEDAFNHQAPRTPGSAARPDSLVSLLNQTAYG